MKQTWVTGAVHWWHLGFYKVSQVTHWCSSGPGHHYFNTLRPRQDVHHFPVDIFKCIFLNENAWILIKILLKFVPKGAINNIPAVVQIMAWHQQGAKPLSEPMMVRLPMHICITQPQWFIQSLVFHLVSNHGLKQCSPTLLLDTHLIIFVKLNQIIYFGYQK